MNISITRLPSNTECGYHTHKEGRKFDMEKILPHGMCPWLYHTVYPYMLGLFSGAKFEFNEHGDCNVSCPASKGVDVLVRRRDNDGSFDPRISEEMNFVIYAEVVKIHGDCPYEHKVNQKIPFPTCMKEHYMCPAAFNNVFPLMNLEPPSCIDTSNLRCPGLGQCNTTKRA